MWTRFAEVSAAMRGHWWVMIMVLIGATSYMITTVEEKASRTNKSAVQLSILSILWTWALLLFNKSLSSMTVLSWWHFSIHGITQATLLIQKYVRVPWSSRTICAPSKYTMEYIIIVHIAYQRYIILRSTVEIYNNYIFFITNRIHINL